jgi:hypothetical protein
MGTHMPSRDKAATPVADQVKDLLRKNLANGWSNTRVAHEMGQRGHPWTENVVRLTASTGEKSGRIVTVDEAVALLAIFKADARMMIREVDRNIAAIEAAAKGARR